MPAIPLLVDNWFALNADIDSRAQWRRFFAAQDNENLDRSGDEMVVLPANMRRRMSSLTKRALQCSLTLAQQSARFDYAVFASRHGELPRTAKLIEGLIAGDDVSPMGFSQSVHNTSAGLHTIISTQRLPVNSIAGGEQTFSQAWIECYIYLQQNPTHSVLLQYFDEPVPDIFQPTCQGGNQNLALGLVLRAGDSRPETLSYGSDDDLLSLLGQIVLAEDRADGGCFALTCY
ncbi:hypothetical protein SIN8267_01629 [Sinobacterium norvegicum]|uniref:Beta-ketoacyl synthase-like N-terminal domain-containing protein n=1 Tax=Sinobacterium norvegicum TaxID=1641715 RepID=A0ABM9AEQ0_9GAMM|nr:beta-ketoacyl synthase chain length factor [Sinobacterium norvegicum]CAH0991523.1 hypothetical protein SIN8267_01629 [Sinobacterium norvegicum]